MKIVLYDFIMNILKVFKLFHYTCGSLISTGVFIKIHISVIAHFIHTKNYSHDSATWPLLRWTLFFVKMNNQAIQSYEGTNNVAANCFARLPMPNYGVKYRWFYLLNFYFRASRITASQLRYSIDNAPIEDKFEYTYKNWIH